MIVLCSKCYYVEETDGEKKLSAKMTSRTQNTFTWQRFKATLEGSKDMSTNRGVSNGQRSYGNLRAEEAGAFCLLRQTLRAGIHTVPIEFHI